MNVGEMLAGRYEIISEIGTGGMAKVYKAKCHVLNRIVAVKVLRPEYTIDEEFVKKFKMEAQSAASLSHPNIVGIYDVGEEDKIHYIIVEYVDGQTLKDLIGERSALTHHEAVKIATQICDALGNAHANHIIHRDIKSSNILISSSGQVKVTDFGIAKAVSAQTVTLTGGIIGSIHYFSPEQARGGVVSARSDVYSLGVVLYEMITGKLPFEGDSPISVALKHIQNEAEPPSSINEMIPKSINDIIMKAIEKDEERRFQNVLELKSDLVKSLYIPQGWYEEEVVPAEEPKEPDAIETDIAVAAMPENKESVADHKGEIMPQPNKPTKDKPKKKVLKRLIITICVILSLVAGMVALGYFGFQFLVNMLTVEEVEVPSLTGLSISEVEAKLQGTDIQYEIEMELFDKNVPEGVVISQDPNPGKSIKIHNSVKLIISKGEQTYTVPSLVGETLQDAIVLLDNAGLLDGTVTYEYSEEIPADIVMEQTPSADTQSTKNATVNLIVSQGKMPEKFFIEDYVGQDEADVIKSLKDLELLYNVSYVESREQEEGKVVTQSPRAGAEIMVGETVTLTISEGPGPSKEREESVLIMIPNSGTPVQVTVVVQDENGTRDVHDRVHPADAATVIVEFEVLGTAVVKVYLNGNLIDEKIFSEAS